MATSNTVFFGCNYNDKKIKAQFDSLKKRIESDTPLSCVVIDKRSGKSARDLWKDIQAHIEDSAACVFDVTGFRPNVVLELGYALSIKSDNQVFITFRKRKSKGKAPTWLLSDIAHLNRHDYVNVPALEAFVRQQLDLIPYSKGLAAFNADCDNTGAADKYRQQGFSILQTVRDEGSKSQTQLQELMAGSSCRIKRMTSLLTRHRLLKRNRGRNGKYAIPASTEVAAG